MFGACPECTLRQRSPEPAPTVLYGCCAAVPEWVGRYKTRLDKLKGILAGTTPIGLHLEFLYRSACFIVPTLRMQGSQGSC